MIIHRQAGRYFKEGQEESSSRMEGLWGGLAVVLLFASSSMASAHPIPDLPVRSFFEADGSAFIQIEVDTRCFADDPATAPYLLLKEYLQLSQKERDQLKAKARDYADQAVDFSFEPGGTVQPNWTFEFTTFQSRPLTRADDPVMLTGSWRFDLAGRTGYWVYALPEGDLGILVLNFYRGEVLRGIQVLFPGESSRTLNLRTLANAETGDPARELLEGVHTSGNWITLWSFMRAGFIHVLPLGLDHILFVLGLFLLSRKCRPLLCQVSTFTVAHTITLGLATTGLVKVPASVVEPVIAGSIIVIALENVFYPKYSPWRLLVVFLFGLVHGLGFAGALSNLELLETSLLTSLLGFNIGVEAGQVTVIVLAFLATVWLRDEKRYRKLMVIPGSILIALMGTYWMFQRIFFIR